MIKYLDLGWKYIKDDKKHLELQFVIKSRVGSIRKCLQSRAPKDKSPFRHKSHGVVKIQKYPQTYRADQ